MMNKTIRFNKDRSKNVKALANELIKHYNEYLANGKRPQYAFGGYICRITVGMKLLDDIEFGRDGDILMEDWYLQQLNIFPDYTLKINEAYWQQPFDRFKSHIDFEFVHK